MSISDSDLQVHASVVALCAERNVAAIGRRVRGKWRSPLWDFVRYLRAHWSAADYSATEAFGLVELVFESWARGGSPYSFGNGKGMGSIGDFWMELCCGQIEPDDARIEFLHLWDKIIVFPGAEVMPKALKLSVERPLELGEVWRTSKYVRFLSFAGHLQSLVGDVNIFLPVALIGSFLHLSPISVSRLRHWAVRDGFLELVEPCRYTERKSAEYRFDMNRFKFPAEENKPERPIAAPLTF